MTDPPSYDVVCIGGGPAGMTAALYTTRLGHRTAVFERTGGRHATASHVHNLYGVSEDVSGSTLSAHAAQQFDEYGGEYRRQTVEQVERTDDGFRVETDASTADATCVVFATGFTDEPPGVPGLQRFVGRGLHYCLHCDAYTLGDSPVYVLGHDDNAATAAMLMLNFTDNVDLLLDGADPTWRDEVDRRLAGHPVERIDTPVERAFPEGEDSDDPVLGGLTFADGRERRYRGGFAMYGKSYNTDLATSIGCERTEEGALAVDDSGRTSVDGAFAVGDVTHGQNQTAIAIADGATAGIAIHKELRAFPREPDAAPMDVPAASDALLARMRRVREQDRHAGLRPPSPAE